MKIEVEILDDQLELLEKIRGLSRLVKEHLGVLPQSFKTGYDFDSLDCIFASMEYDCKKWVIETMALNSQLSPFLSEVSIYPKRFD